MQLDEKRSKLFVGWYQDRYGKLDNLPELPKDKEDNEYKIRSIFIQMLVGGMRPKKYRWKPIYKYILDQLRLNYGPVFTTNENNNEI